MSRFAVDDPAFYRQRDTKGACALCQLALTENAPDPCLGELPGVVAACCGHGDIDLAYVLFGNGVIIRGFDAVEQSEYAEIIRSVYAAKQP